MTTPESNSGEAELIAKIRDKLGSSWIPEIYRERVRTRRTRSYSLDLPDRRENIEILHTLLGIELKVGNHRFACPDLATARYIQVFARIGCDSFAIPYDITKISAVADELETAWHLTMLTFDEAAALGSEKARSRTRRRLIRAICSEIAGIGAGEGVPEFKESTKQRGRS